MGIDLITIRVRMPSGPSDQDAASIEVPMQLKRCGPAVRLIVNAPGTPRRSAPDAKLVALLTKAHDWFGRLTSGRDDSIATIARAEGLTGSYVTRVVQLAFLAPDIVERIARGHQPPTLNAERLSRQVPLPMDWTVQRAKFGFDR